MPSDTPTVLEPAGDADEITASAVSRRDTPLAAVDAGRRRLRRDGDAGGEIPFVRPAPRAKSNRLLFWGLLGGAVFLLCGGIVFTVYYVRRNATPRTVTATDNSCQVTMQGKWRVDNSLNKEAVLQTVSRLDDAYFLVLPEPKIDFEDGFTYRDHSRITRQQMMEKMKNGWISNGPVELVIDGRKAVQYEMRGSVDGARVVCLHTTVDGRNSFYQLLGWTTPSRWQKTRLALSMITRSFREK